MGHLDRLLMAGVVNAAATRLQLIVVDPFSAVQEGNKRAPGTVLVDCTLHHADYDDFCGVVQGFMEAVAKEEACGSVHTQDIAVACLAVPGPVETVADNGRMTATLKRVELSVESGLTDRGDTETNGPSWVLDQDELQRRLRLRNVHLLNDFLAVGYALLTLGRHETITLQDAPVVPQAPKTLLGTGRGLEQCYLTYHDGEYTAWPSQGGHCEFAPKTELQVDLLRYLKARHNESHSISVERVVSTKGLETVYDFLSEKYQAIRDNRIHRTIQAAKDRNAAITAFASTDRLCYKALEIFTWTYGSEAGCAALKWLPYGGLYITGNLAPHQIKHLQSDTTFIDAYYDKGRVNPLMRQVPVKVVIARDLELRGAHYVAFRILQERLGVRRLQEIVIPYKVLYGAMAVVAALALVCVYRSVRRP